MREQKPGANQHLSKGVQGYHKLEVDNGIRELRHAHLDRTTA